MLLNPRAIPGAYPSNGDMNLDTRARKNVNYQFNPLPFNMGAYPSQQLNALMDGVRKFQKKDDLWGIKGDGSSLKNGTREIEDGFRNGIVRAPGGRICCQSSCRTLIPKVMTWEVVGPHQLVFTFIEDISKLPTYFRQEMERNPNMGAFLDLPTYTMNLVSLNYMLWAELKEQINGGTWPNKNHITPSVILSKYRLTGIVMDIVEDYSSSEIFTTSHIRRPSKSFVYSSLGTLKTRDIYSRIDGTDSRVGDHCFIKFIKVASNDVYMNYKSTAHGIDVGNDINDETKYPFKIIAVPICSPRAHLRVEEHEYIDPSGEMIGNFRKKCTDAVIWRIGEISDYDSPRRKIHSPLRHATDTEKMNDTGLMTITLNIKLLQLI
jgi:hypothetical protein